VFDVVWINQRALAAGDSTTDSGARGLDPGGDPLVEPAEGAPGARPVGCAAPISTGPSAVLAPPSAEVVPPTGRCVGAGVGAGFEVENDRVLRVQKKYDRPVRAAVTRVVTPARVSAP
jgi:hypothetical protein